MKDAVRTAKPSLNLNNRVSPALYHRGRSKKNRLVDVGPAVYMKVADLR